MSGASRLLSGPGLLVDVVSTAAATALPLLMVVGAWRFMCPAKPRPRLLTLALLSALTIRMVLSAFVSIGTNRAIYAALVTLCVAYCCQGSLG